MSYLNLFNNQSGGSRDLSCTIYNLPVHYLEHAFALSLTQLLSKLYCLETVPVNKTSLN